MAYIYYDGKKYYAIKEFETGTSDIKSNKSVEFEVDELMAIPIAALNNKGYLTEMCCSGHAIGNLCCELANQSEIEKYEKAGNLLAVRHDAEDNTEYMYWVNDSLNVDEVYIIFKQDERFESVPCGWKYNNKHKRLSYDIAYEKNPISIYRRACAALESLLMWIQELPDHHIEEDLKHERGRN